MIIILFSVLAFIITIPIKAALLAGKVAVRSSELLRDRIQINRGQRNHVITKRRIRRAIRFAKFAIKTIIAIIRLAIIVIALFFSIFSFILSSTFILPVLTAGSTVATMLALEDYDWSGLGKGKDKESDSDEIESLVDFDNSDVSGNEKKALRKCANWYINNVYTYWCTVNRNGHMASAEALRKRLPFTKSGDRGYYDCSFSPYGKAGDDCTSFSRLFMSVVSGADVGDHNSGTLVNDAAYAKHLEKFGWYKYSMTQIKSLDDLREGDVMASTECGHAEVFVDNTHSFGWGYIHTTFPANNRMTFTGSSVNDNSHKYTVFFRYKGSGKGKKKD